MGGFNPGVFNYNPGNLTGKKGLGNALGNQYGTNEGLESQQQKQRGSEYGTLMPQYQSLLNSGYSPQEKSAIEAGTTGAISSGYGAAGQAAGRNLAATGNSAGYGSTLTSLARNKSKDMAQQENQNQVEFAQRAMQNKMAGLQGIAQLYGVDTSFLNSLGQQQNQVLGVGNSIQSRSRGVLGSINAGLNLFGLGNEKGV